MNKRKPDTAFIIGKKIMIGILAMILYVSCTADITDQESGDTYSFRLNELMTLSNTKYRQSIAVYGKYMISSHQFGELWLYDLEKKAAVCNVTVPVDKSTLTSIHGSNISFGNEFPEGNTELPAIYVCETTGMKRCFVIDLHLDGTVRLIQTIEFNGSFGKPEGNDYRDFLVDKENNSIWIVGYNDYTSSGDFTICKKVPLKGIGEGNISYSDSDVLTEFEIKEINVIQGAFISSNHLFIGDQRRWIVNIDLDKKSIVGYLKFDKYTEELEGISVYDGFLIVDIDGVIMKVSKDLYSLLT